MTWEELRMKFYIAAQMEILAENEVSASGEETVGDDQRMRSHFLEGVPITLQLQSSKMGPEFYILVKKEMT
jgi:hypothetical protein